MKNGDTNKFDPESISYLNIWTLSWPVMVSSLGFTLLNTVDMFWIGKLGHVSVAAVSIVGSLFWLLMSSIALVSSGTVAFVSRAAGSGDSDLLKNSISLSLFSSLIISVLIVVPSFIFARQILGFFGAENNVLREGAVYLYIMLTGFPVIFIFEIFNNAFFGIGDSKTPMKITFIALVINIILDPFLVFGWSFFPRLETAGAAIASVFSLFAGFSIYLLFFFRKFGFIVPAVHTKIFSQFFKTGVPAFFYGITRPITGTLMYRIVALYGTSSIAAFGIGSRVIGITFIYMDGLMIAVQTFVGQLLGKKDPKKAKKAAMRSLKMGYSVQIFTCAFMFLFSDKIIAFFNTNPDVLLSGSSYLKVIGISLVFYPLSATFSAVHRGSGYNIPPLIASVVSNWIIKLPLSYALAKYLGLDYTGVWIGIGFSLLIESTILAFYYKKGDWSRHSVPPTPCI
ncbi:MATE family efflux transporter [candidate division WOR-3 bacterium]|nr:MATE family efflux transporter [candidate division WOR-3 bacterium]